MTDRLSGKSAFDLIGTGREGEDEWRATDDVEFSAQDAYAFLPDADEIREVLVAWLRRQTRAWRQHKFVISMIISIMLLAVVSGCQPGRRVRVTRSLAARRSRCCGGWGC